jgi:hypothetical protein
MVGIDKRSISCYHKMDILAINFYRTLIERGILKWQRLRLSEQEALFFAKL